MGKVNRRERLQSVPRVDVFQITADRIAAGVLRNGGMVATSAHPSLPVHADTGLPYRGINAALLFADQARRIDDAEQAEPVDPRYCTFNAARRAGWTVRGGEHAAGHTVFYKKIITRRAGDAGQRDDIDDDLEQLAANGDRFILLPRRVPVFHASQIEGIPPYEPAVLDDALPAVSQMCAALQVSSPDLPAGPHSRQEVVAASIRNAVWQNPAMSRDPTSVLVSDLATAIVEAEFGLPHQAAFDVLFPEGSETRDRSVNALVNILQENPKQVFRVAATAQVIADNCLGCCDALQVRMAERQMAQRRYQESMDAGQHAMDASASDSLDDLFDPPPPLSKIEKSMRRRFR